MTRLPGWAYLLLWVIAYTILLVLVHGLWLSSPPAGSESVGTIRGGAESVPASAAACQVPAQEVVATPSAAPPGHLLCPSGLVSRIESQPEPLIAKTSARGVGGLRPAEAGAVMGASAGAGGNTPTVGLPRVWRVTAYCPGSCCCGSFADGRTASGTRTDHRLVAAPPEIPFGTVLDVPGYGRVKVEDRGGSIKGNRLDVLFPTHAEALEWGVRNLNVEVMP